MLEQIKELCLFLICGQTLLYFQSGKKYEKICRMILELLILAGIVGAILNFLQSAGFRKGEMEAAGSAVAGMQRNMEEALSKQLGMEGISGNFLAGEEMEKLIEKHTTEEIKSSYNNFAMEYGYEIQKIKNEKDKLQVFLIDVRKNEKDYEDNSAETDGIKPVEIGEISIDRGYSKETEEEMSEKDPEKSEEELTSFRRQFALVLGMEEEKLEVILVDR